MARPKIPIGGHCLSGLHKWTDKNTYIDARGYAGCRLCRSARRRRHYAKNRAKTYEIGGQQFKRVSKERRDRFIYLYETYGQINQPRKLLRMNWSTVVKILKSIGAR